MRTTAANELLIYILQHAEEMGPAYVELAKRIRAAEHLGAECQLADDRASQAAAAVQS